MRWLVFGEIPIILLGLIWGPKSEKIEKMHFSPFYLCFVPPNCLKMIENGKKYHNREFGVTPITGLGFRAQKVGFDVWVLR